MCSQRAIFQLTKIIFCFSYSVNDNFRTALHKCIIHLGVWLDSSQMDVQNEAAHALLMLSYNKDNCKLMYRIGVNKVRQDIIELINFYQFTSKSLVKQTLNGSINKLFHALISPPFYVIFELKNESHMLFTIISCKKVV